MKLYRAVRVATVSCLVTMAMTNVSLAELTDIGNGLIYDSNADVTWISNGLYFSDSFQASTDSLGLIGLSIATPGGAAHTTGASDFSLVAALNRELASWWGASAWASTLQYPFGTTDVGGWSLPTQAQLSSLWLSLGSTAAFGANINPFTYVLPKIWSADGASDTRVTYADFVPSVPGTAPNFGTIEPINPSTNVPNYSNVWAVHPGNVAQLVQSGAMSWVNSDNILEQGTSIQAIAANSSKNGYTGNPALNHDAWGHQGTWLSFQVKNTTTTTITLSSAATNAPGFTIYRTDGAFTGENATGAADPSGTKGGTNGAIHDFNQVAQAGTAGIIWATDDSVTTSLPGNTTTNGIVETLGYVNASEKDYINNYGANVKAGAYDLSIDNLYENGVYGSVARGDMNIASLTLKNLKPGSYTLFLGGTDSDGVNGPIDVTVSASPAPVTDCVFNWLEQNNAQKYAPAGAMSETTGVYYYRAYANTKNYLGVSAKDNHAYEADANLNLKDLGDLSALAASAGCK